MSSIPVVVYMYFRMLPSLFWPLSVHSSTYGSVCPANRGDLARRKRGGLIREDPSLPNTNKPSARMGSLICAKVRVMVKSWTRCGWLYSFYTGKSAFLNMAVTESNLDHKVRKMPIFFNDCATDELRMR